MRPPGQLWSVSCFCMAWGHRASTVSLTGVSPAPLFPTLLLAPAEFLVWELETSLPVSYPKGDSWVLQEERVWVSPGKEELMMGAGSPLPPPPCWYGPGSPHYSLLFSLRLSPAGASGLKLCPAPRVNIYI